MKINKSKVTKGFLVAFLLISMSAAVLVPKAHAGSPGDSSTPANGTQAQEQL